MWYDVRTSVGVELSRRLAMESVAIGELEQHAGAIIRRVREKREEVAITDRGRVVARIVPAEDEQEMRKASREAWKRLEELGKEISAAWPEGVSAVEAIREQRREL